MQAEAKVLEIEDRQLRKDLALAHELKDACVEFLCDADARRRGGHALAVDIEATLDEAQERVDHFEKQIAFNEQLDAAARRKAHRLLADERKRLREAAATRRATLHP